LGRCLKVDARVADYLFGADAVDERLRTYAKPYPPAARVDPLLLPPGLMERLLLLARRHQLGETPTICYFQGPHGAGKQTTAEVICGELGVTLLVVDGEALLNAGEPAFATAVQLVMREALLHDAVLYWKGFDALLADDRQPACDTLLGMLAAPRGRPPGLSILAGDATWEPTHAEGELCFIRVEFPRPGYNERLQLWPQLLQSAIPLHPEVDLKVLAAQFRFTAGQIHAAAATARNLAAGCNPTVNFQNLRAKFRRTTPGVRSSCLRTASSNCARLSTRLSTARLSTTGGDSTASWPWARA
jgi:hypothetical protein